MNRELPSTRTRRAWLGAPLVAALLFASCGGSDSSDSTDVDGGGTGDDATVVTEPLDVNAVPTGENVAPVASAVGAEADLVDEAVAGTDATPEATTQETGPISFTGAPLPIYDVAAGDPSLGIASPIVSGQGFDGTPIAIGGPSDNPTLLVFLAHWCPHCNDEVPTLIGLQEAGSLPVGLDVVGVSTAADSTRDNYPPSEWAEELNWPWPMMADDDVLTAISVFGGSSFPFAVIVDADGTVLGRKAGASDAAGLSAFIEGALS
ncbi:MAG: TlpA family protein disulfide reductase [Ilumatobacter sp.]|uniref:TlpA family protein disulfide reductase n=1 Tax=Ilumatobacter sp. TaxID=1967498 RepID=UPI00391DBA77